MPTVDPVQQSTDDLIGTQSYPSSEARLSNAPELDVAKGNAKAQAKTAHQVNVVTSPSAPPATSEIDERDTQSPLKLFFQDAIVFLNIVPMLPYAILPSNAKDDGDVQLSDSWRGKRDKAIVVVVSVAQFLLLPAVLLGWLVLPCSVYVLFGLVIGGVMKLLLWITEGPRYVQSRAEPDAENGPHARERWVFINGIMTRSGFFGDIFECLIQRCFSYCTRDVRVAYERLNTLLTDPNVDKVVLIAHSQGGIIASLCVDHLFTKLPQELMSKLEIYTFGSAASHFSNPTHESDADPPKVSKAEAAVSTVVVNPITSSKIVASQLDSPSSKREATQPRSSCPEHVIRYMEHYANSKDPIPRWGVLHSVYSLFSRRYAGTLFVRLGASGHYFTSHYLAAWFPTDASEAEAFGERRVGLEKAVIKKRETVSMGTQVKSDSVGGAVGEGDFNGRQHSKDDLVARADTMEWGDDRPAGMKLLDDVEKARKALEEGQLNFVAEGDGYDASMKGLSRLWLYMNGGSPPA